MNLPAIFIILTSALLYTIGYRILIRQAERRKVSETLRGIKRTVRKPALSKKKREIVETLSSRVKKKATSVTFMMAFIPLIFFMIATTIPLFAGIPIVRSPCILPSPFSIEANGMCYLFSTWIALFTYLAFSPFYFSVTKKLLPRREETSEQR